MLTLQNQTGKGCLDLRRALASAPYRGEHKPFFGFSEKVDTFSVLAILLQHQVFSCFFMFYIRFSKVDTAKPRSEAPADKRRAAPKSGGRALIGAASRLFCCMRRILISIGFLFSCFPAGSLCSDTFRTSDIINACVKYTPVNWMYLFIISDIIAYTFKN